MDKQYILDMMRFWDSEQIADFIMNHISARDAELAKCKAQLADLEERHIVALRVLEKTKIELADQSELIRLWRQSAWFLDEHKKELAGTTWFHHLWEKGEI